MPSIDVVKRVAVPAGFRVSRVQGMFDVPIADEQRFHLSLDVPIESLPDWRVGVIVGASGTGKTTLARELFGRAWLPQDVTWQDHPIVDEFPKEATVESIVSSLIGVGLASAPVWLRPYAVLSTGEQFRATMARLLIEEHDPLVVDEFTSVVDRVVARAVSSAVSRVVRSAGRRFVAVSCHHDIVDWLAPDWIVDLDQRRFLQRGEDQRRPPIQLRLYRGSLEAWPLFRGYHYMTGQIAPNARVFLATVTFPDDAANERLCGFFSILPAIGMRGWVRGHRTVVLPDFQGLGVGNKMIELTADWLWESQRLRVRATTSAPGLVRHRRRHPEAWRLVSGPMNRPQSENKKIKVRTSAGRLTTSWEYVPRALRQNPEGDSRERLGAGIERGHVRAAVGG